MLDPVLSPKLEAFVTVLDEIKTLKLKRGLFPADYTREVNREIDGIRARLLAAAKRAKKAEGLRKLCEENPEFAANWKILKLQTGYINAAKRQDKIYKELEAMNGAKS